MRTIYLVRHGEPDFPNGEKFCLGRTDLPLSKQGLAQAELLHRYFQDKGPFSVYCSPLLRARQTAERISENCIVSDWLTEMDLGDWDGRPFAEIRELYPELYEKRGQSPFSVTPPNAEALPAFRNRVLAAFHALLDATAGDLVLVSHAGINRILLQEMLPLPENELFSIRQSYGCVSILEYAQGMLRVKDIHIQPELPKQASALWQWEPDMIRFMNDASQYGSYDAELAAAIRPYLSPEDNICDLGCGLAYLSMALAPSVKEITAVDINRNVLSAVRDNCAKYSIQNLHTYCVDANALPLEWQFDAMVFCFYGQIDDVLHIAARHCRKHVFVVKRNYSAHRFSVGKHKMDDDNYESTCAYLDRLGIRYEATALCLEHGQPFTGMADARRFFELYSKDKDLSLITDAFLSEKLQATGREDFPYYLPQPREIGLFHLDASTLPKHGE